MRALTFDFDENLKIIDTSLNISENFDILKKEMDIKDTHVVFYYIDGFVTAGIMQKLMMHISTVTDFGNNSHESSVEFIKKSLPSVESDPEYDVDKMCKAVLKIRVSTNPSREPRITLSFSGSAFILAG